MMHVMMMNPMSRNVSAARLETQSLTIRVRYGVLRFSQIFGWSMGLEARTKKRSYHSQKLVK